MAVWKCNACGGSYNDTLKDGTIYFHSCSPTPPNAQGAQSELPNKRDENIVLDTQGHFKGIVSHGAGVAPMQGQGGTDPSWLVQITSQPQGSQ